MNKKIAIPAIALVLMLSTMAFMPTWAITKEDYWAKRVRITDSEYEKTWVADGIWHGRHKVETFSYEGSLGKGTETVFVEVVNLNLKNMETNCRGTSEIVILEDGEEVGTIAGTWTLKLIYGEVEGTVKFTLTHGKGSLDGVKVFGIGTRVSYPDPAIFLDEGTVIWPE